MARAALKAAVERAVTKDTTVIADGLNYIKGYRYELYCVVRSAGSTHVCLFVDGPVEAARRANEDRAAAGGAAASYPDAVCVTQGSAGMWLLQSPGPASSWRCRQHGC